VRKNLTGAVTILFAQENGPLPALWLISKILIKFDLLGFDSNTRLIRVDFIQKRRFVANDNFKPAC
jgi:hypothetical protein